MSRFERIKMVKAMEYIARNVNDEDVFQTWLAVGVADGDIPYGSLMIEDDDLDTLEYYTDDAAFADLMDTFLSLMYSARQSGGLYCDQIISRRDPQC